MIALNRFKDFLPDRIKPMGKELIRKVRMMFLSNKAGPDFIIAGIRKGGTSSLYYYLTQHPQVAGTLEKELNFFDRNYEKGLPWYLSNFTSKKKEGKFITGEASPQYQYHHEVPSRIKKHFPSIKLIFILREPVGRAISDANFDLKHGAKASQTDANIRLRNEVEFFVKNKDLILDKFDKDAISIANEIPLIYRGLYSLHLRNWFKIFDPKQILFIDFSDFIADTQKQMNIVTNFLGIDNYDFSNLKIYNENKEAKAHITEETKLMLKDFFKEHIEGFKKLIAETYPST